MKVIAIRDTVHASDEPEPFSFDIADDAPHQAVLRRAANRAWLPSIQGDRATWAIISNQTLAVVAYQWPDIKFLPGLDGRMRAADRSRGVLRLHFKYLAQTDPETVYDMLRRPGPRAGGARSTQPGASTVAAPADERRDYAYQPAWRAMGFRVGIFSAAGLFLGYGAAHDHRAWTIDGLIALTADQASLYAWVLTMGCAGFVLAALWQGFRRLTSPPPRLVLTRTSVIIPTWRGDQSIDYGAIRKLDVITVRGITLLLIHHADGKARIFRALTPSKAAFDEIRDWIKARAPGAGR